MASDTIDRAEAQALLGWWLDAGVDVAIGESPRDWLRGAAPPPPEPAAAQPAAERPATLDAFHAWLGSASDLPLARPGARRVLPVGAPNAPLMVLGDLPGPDELADNRPIGGEAWALAVRMLAAIGLKPDQAYLAGLSCFHAPGARMARGLLDQCGELAREHVRLAAPARLLLLGDAPARALTGQPLAAARGRVHRIEGVRAVATFHPRWLLQRPSDKALAWRDLMLLMSEEE